MPSQVCFGCGRDVRKTLLYTNQGRWGISDDIARKLDQGHVYTRVGYSVPDWGGFR